MDQTINTNATSTEYASTIHSEVKWPFHSDI